MPKIYRGLKLDAKFERANLRLRRKLRQQIQTKLIQYSDDKHYYPCNKALDKIDCANDMHFMLSIINSSRPHPLEYIIQCVNNMEERRYKRWSEEAFGFWYP